MRVRAQKRIWSHLDQMVSVFWSFFTSVLSFMCEGGDGWFYLGPCAKNKKDQTAVGVIVKEIVPKTLADIVGWERIWSNKGGRGPALISLWRGIPPNPEYVVLGDFLVQGEEQPTKEQTQFIKAVHKNACIRGSFGSQIWTDAGSRAPEDAAVWDISNEHGLKGLRTGAFVATLGYKETERAVYVLDMTKLLVD